MKVKVTQEDIDSGINPIENAIARDYDRKCTVDRRFLIFESNKYPFRLPLSAEYFIQRWFQGKSVEPFTFDIAD